MLSEQRRQRLQLEIWQLQKPSEVLHLLREIGEGKVGLSAQQALLDCITNSTSQTFSPGKSYLDRVLKAVTLSAENEEESLIEDLVEFHQQVLLEIPKAAGQWESSATWCYKTYSYGAAVPETGRCDQSSSHGAGQAEGLITLHLSQNLFEGSTGCHEWEAGFLLSEYIFSHPNLFKGRRCCELGCGSGLVGISLDRIGAASVLLTDGDAETLLNCRHNLSINDVLTTEDHEAASPSVAKDIEMAQIEWESGGSLDADILLGADLLYDPGSYTALAKLIGSSLRVEGAAQSKYMIMATTIRDEANVASFLELLTESGLQAELLGNGDLQSLVVLFRCHLELNKLRGTIQLHKITVNVN